MSAEASLGSEIFFRVLKYVVSLICICSMLPLVPEIIVLGGLAPHSDIMYPFENLYLNWS